MKGIFLYSVNAGDLMLMIFLVLYVRQQTHEFNSYHTTVMEFDFLCRTYIQGQQEQAIVIQYSTAFFTNNYFSFALSTVNICWIKSGPVSKS